MPEELVLKNDELLVTISTLGAELQSVKKGSEEYIWIGDPGSFKFHAPLLFPIIGIMKDNKYIYNDKVYHLENHGYGRFLEFELESYSSQKAVFLHRYNDETLKMFPFKYELRISYILNDSSLKIEHKIKNLDCNEMYFSIGSHEAYYCPEGIEEYSIIFEKSEVLDYCLAISGLLEHKTENIGMNITEFPLKYEYFENKSLIFLNLKSREVSLKNRRSGKIVSVKFDNEHTAFTLWTIPGKQYICLEPWCGMPDFIDSDCNIKNKKGIISLSGYGETVRTHEIYFG